MARGWREQSLEQGIDREAAFAHAGEKQFCRSSVSRDDKLTKLHNIFRLWRGAFLESSEIAMNKHQSRNDPLADHLFKACIPAPKRILAVLVTAIALLTTEGAQTRRGTNAGNALMIHRPLPVHAPLGSRLANLLLNFAVLEPLKRILAQE